VSVLPSTKRDEPRKRRRGKFIDCDDYRDHHRCGPRNSGCPTFAPAYVGRKRRANPDFLYAAPPMFARAAFCKECRMKFLDSPSPTGNPGKPHHCFCSSAAKVSPVASFWENNGNKPSWSQVSRFPVEIGGVVELHAAFRKESSTRGPVWCCVTGIRVR